MSEKLTCILCIDDDEATNYFNKALIERLGVTEHLVMFDDAGEALQYLAQPSVIPDLILLDINMPKVNGWDFLDEYLKRGLDQTLKHTEIVVVTTSANPQDQLKARTYACISGFEKKVLDAPKIRKILREYFDFNPGHKDEREITA